MALQFVNISREEFFETKLLYKYMPLEYALTTLNNKTLWFANPAIWSDPFEKRFLEATYNRGGRNTVFPWKDRTFCICMTQTMTSEAHWNTYSKDAIGISFRINKEELVNQLENLIDWNVYIGKVEYMKTADIKKNLSQIPFKTPMPKYRSREFFVRLLLLKRVAFEYENEIRVIIVKKNKTQEKGISVPFNCNNTDLIHSIMLDPRLGDEVTKMLKEVFVQKYSFTPFVINDRPKYRVLKSQLYADLKPPKLDL